MRTIGAGVALLSSAHDAGLDLSTGPDRPSAMITAGCRVGRALYRLAQIVTPVVDQKLASGNIHVHLNTPFIYQNLNLSFRKNFKPQKQSFIAFANAYDVSKFKKF